MANASARLRKYKRKKDAAKCAQKWDRLARLYWRYHIAVYGPPGKVWIDD